MGAASYHVNLALLHQPPCSARTLRRSSRLSLGLGGNSNGAIRAATLSPNLLALSSMKILYLHCNRIDASGFGPNVTALCS
jgi:hypothetical protein